MHSRHSGSGSWLIPRRRLFVLGLLSCPVFSATAQVAVSPERVRHPDRHIRIDPVGAKRSGASGNFDATFYHLQIDLDFVQERITGTTRVEGVLTAPGSELRLDLLSNLAVQAVRDDAGDPLSYSHADDVLAIDLGGTVAANERLELEVDYAGQPQFTGLGAFGFDVRDGQPVAWTLSEPYGARAWWPGKDHPSDKVDSARVTVTVPEGLRVGSNGTLKSVDDVAGRVTYDWVVGYPIAPYLLSLAVGPYATFDQTYVRPDSLAGLFGRLSLPVVHYKYTSGGTADLPDGWAEVLDALAVFEWWFGPYPFPTEKYGHAEFGWRGGMEHQTLSSMGGSSVGLVTHELAHQWFGDAVTNRTWPHLWLNEGFASYAEVLYWETMRERYGGMAESALRVDQSSARSAQGTLVVEDTLNVSNLFAGSRVYAKGSAVLHMLRKVVGDEVFRTILHAYLADPALAYGTAVTSDFQRLAEAVSGRSLDVFFRQWITEGTGYPRYAVSASHRRAADGGYDLDVTIRQTQTPPESNVHVFVMPITLAVETAGGEERFVVQNTRREERFTIHVDALPTDVRFDPDGTLLSNEDVLVSPPFPDIPTEFSFQLAPNPTDGPLRISAELPTSALLRLELVDLLGRHVGRLWEGVATTGQFGMDASLDHLAAGVYFVCAHYGSKIETKPVVVLP